MSSSEKSSKIDLLDSAESIAAKLKDAFCPEAVVEGNGVLAFVKMVLFAVSGVAGRKQGFTVRRPEKFGGDSHYASYAELEAAYVAKQVFPLDLKNSVAAALNELLQPIRQHFTSQEMKELVARAYPKEDAAGAAGGEAVILDDEDDPAVAAASAAAASSAAAAAAAAAAPAAKGGKAGAKGGKSASAAAAAPAGPVADPNAPMDIARLDIKVGRVIKAENHPRADKLYLSSVDCGDASGPRQVVSGLKAHVALEALQGRLVAVLTNLKPTSLVGVKSHAMILAAANADGTSVELVDVPEGAQVGERVQFAGFPTDASLPELAKANENTLSKVLPELKTDAQGNVQWKGVDACTSAGKLTVKSLFNVQVK
jgi:methionine--tRNA ligase beta chain